MSFAHRSITQVSLSFFPSRARTVWAASLRTVVALSCALGFAPKAFADSCIDFANETAGWMESGPGRVVRTVVTAHIDGVTYEGFTFSQYSRATSGRFGLAGALLNKRMAMSIIGSSSPAFEMSWRLTLIDEPRISARHLTDARPLGFVSASSCERLPSVGGWRVESTSLTTGNEIIFEMAFDSLPR